MIFRSRSHPPMSESAHERRFVHATSTSASPQRTNPLTRERAARGAEFVATTECQLR
jgi:hypothetical protein